MPSAHFTTGFRTLALGSSLFLVPGLAYRLEPSTLLGFALTAAGFFLASTARDADEFHWGRVGLGLVISYIGMMPFFFDAFFPLETSGLLLATVTVYLTGVLASAGGSFLAMRFGYDQTARLLTRGGVIGIAVAGLVWTPLHMTLQDYWWIPANIATLIGGLLVLAGLFRPDPAAIRETGPSKA